jgi:hypothetical protein
MAAFLTLKLRNSALIEFLLENSLVFQNRYKIAPLYGYSGRELSRITKKKFGSSCKTSLMLLV